MNKPTLQVEELPFKVRGDMKITVRDAVTNEVLRTIEIRNTITYAGLTALVYLIAQRAVDPVPGDKKITALRASTGAVAPTRNDTTLATPAGEVTLALADGDKTPTVAAPLFELKLTTTMDAATGNGKNFVEAGVFMSDATMIARQIHPLIAKSVAIIINYDWRLTFTA